MVTAPTPLQELKHPLLDQQQVNLLIKRDDLIHPEIMGNKWRKMKYNLEKLQKSGLKKLVTFGGAFSNHIAATAAAGRIMNIETLGIIRGEELNPESNHTLSKARKDGMQFRFVSREEFRAYRNDPKWVLEAYPNHYFLPEGGTNKLAIRGVTELLDEIFIPFDWIVTPVGTGGTFCGLVKGSGSNKVYGVSALKGSFMKQEIESLLHLFGIQNKNYELDLSHHFGGYAKSNNELESFANWFKDYFNIQLDPIYTAKSTFAVWKKIEEGYFGKNQTIILLHTGGLQGIKP